MENSRPYPKKLKNPLEHKMPIFSGLDERIKNRKCMKLPSSMAIITICTKIKKLCAKGRAVGKNC